MGECRYEGKNGLSYWAVQIKQVYRRPVIQAFDSPSRNWYGINDHRSILTVTSGDKIYEAVLRFDLVSNKCRDDRRMQYPMGAIAGGRSGKYDG